MTTDELITALNKDAVRLGLRRPITPRMVRDWVDEGLIARRKAKGRKRGRHPIWEFSENDFCCAMKMVKLKASNIHRVAELRLHLWIGDETYPIDRIADALQSEFARLMHREHRKLRFKYDHRHDKPLSDKDVQRYSNQLPPVDRGLAEAGFKIQPKAIVEIISELLRGNGHEKFPQLIAEEAARILGVSSNDFASQLDLTHLAGLFGVMDEISGSAEEELNRVSEADLLEARRQLWNVIPALRIGEIFARTVPEFPGIASAFERTEWIVSTLAAFALQALRKRIGAGG